MNPERMPYPVYKVILSEAIVDPESRLSLTKRISKLSSAIKDLDSDCWVEDPRLEGFLLALGGFEEKGYISNVIVKKRSKKSNYVSIYKNPTNLMDKAEYYVLDNEKSTLHIGRYDENGDQPFFGTAKNLDENTFQRLIHIVKRTSFDR